MTKSINVLMVGSQLSVKGGMTTVVNGFLNREFNSFNLYYIPTHIESNKINQVLFFIISFIRIIYYLIFKNISIFHIHLSERGSFTRKCYVSKLAKLFNKKIVIHMHGAEFKEFYYISNADKKLKIINFLKDADKVIVLGESWKNFIYNLDNEIKIEVMPNFVKSVSEIVKFDYKKIRIVFLAVLIKRKGIFDLIESINLLIKEDSSKQLEVIIAGSGKEQEEAIKRVKELNLEDIFIFTGWVDDNKKMEILLKSQIFVLPSYNEGLPVSILEAMSCGLPVVSTNVGSIEDAVINDYNGIIVNPGDINSLKEALRSLINNSEKWNQYSLNGKKIIKEKYEEELYFSNLETLYENIIK